MTIVRRKGFTIVELLVVVSIIALLIGILLPAIGKARDQARLTISQTNLRQLGQAHATYAAEWNNRQFTVVNDNLAKYGNSISAAVNAYQAQAGEHPAIWLGWGSGSNNGLWGYWMSHPGNHPLLLAIDFWTYEGFGWFRIPNAKQFSNYVSGRYYDPVFYAPKDRVVQAILEPCLDSAGEFNTCIGTSDTVWSSYCLSPAALYSPDVFRNQDAGGFQNPLQLPGGLRVPSFNQVRYPDLKTHMLEHHWLQQTRADCNPGFADGTYDGCEPYYFNMAWESVAMTLFYDGHVEGLGVQEAMASDDRFRNQSGNSITGLWSRDTPMGATGYFSDIAYDWSNTSFHIFTTDGISGRDKVGQ